MLLIASKSSSMSIGCSMALTVLEHTIDLRVEIIVRDNAELVDILESKGYGWR